MNCQLNFEALLHTERIKETLAALCLKKKIGDASVVLSIGNTRRCWRANKAGNVVEDDSMHILTGCLTKSLTASLFTAVLQQHASELHTPIGKLAPRSQLLNHSALCELTGVQLLTHTHGLDDSVLDQIWSNDGSLSKFELAGELLAQSVPLAEPGTLYSYGNAGAILAALLIEHITQSNYEDALHQFLCGPLGLTPFRSNLAIYDEENFIRATCPASGGALTLTIRDVAAYLQWQVGPANILAAPALSTVPILLRSHRKPLAGWSPFEQAVCLGWKCYGGGWFGHNSNLCGHSLLARFSPEFGITLVVATRDSQSKSDTALTVLLNLFGEHLPEFSKMKTPRRLNSEEVNGLQGNRLTGTYANSREAVRIDADLRPFKIRVSRVLDDQLIAECNLVPAVQEIFFTDPMDPHLFPYFQFIWPDSARRFPYIWNGKTIWPRRNS